jgi:hypothetical protein
MTKWYFVRFSLRRFSRMKVHLLVSNHSMNFIYVSALGRWVTLKLDVDKPVKAAWQTSSNFPEPPNQDVALELGVTQNLKTQQTPLM